MDRVEERSDTAMSPYTGLAQAMEELQKRGFTANFEMVNHKFIEVESGRAFTPDQLAIVDHRRFEGVSDPDDMSVLYSVESTDGVKGIVVDAFGTYGNPELGEFLEGVRFREHRRLQALAA